MSKTDQDVDKNYVDGGVKAAENYANKEGNRKMASNLNRPAKGAQSPQTNTPGASANPNIKRGGLGVPNALKSNIQRGGFGATGRQLQNQIPGGKSINDARNGNLSQAARNLAEDAAKEVAKKAAMALATNPLFWLFIIIALIILFIFWLLMGTDLDKPTNPCTNTAGGAAADTLTIKVDGPQAGKIGDPITYTFTIADTQQDQDITIIDHLPDGVSLTQADITSTWAKMTFDPAQKTITWKASENQGTNAGAAPNTNPQPPANAGGSATSLASNNATFTVTLKSTANNTSLVNYADANATRGAAPAAGGTGSGAVSDDIWNQFLAMEKQYIDKNPNWGVFINDARTVSQQQAYPISVIVGQGSLETGHGSSNIAKTKANYFGLKVYDANPGAGTAYADPLQSIQDYVALIKGGNSGKNSTYLEAYANRADPAKMVELIRAAGYATDPSYVSKVTGQPEFKLLAGVPVGAPLPGADAGGGAAGCPPASAHSLQQAFIAKVQVLWVKLMPKSLAELAQNLQTYQVIAVLYRLQSLPTIA